ncbi:protein N-terminal asparagine amidohydrolase-like [Mizuhopecten yessoensis]|uniref:Protein N-terminal asparagine amidohydrolase n=1 Tax=Mizuhopecten yessoensis TaxID=6573 RepID=A0A210PV55_MIZYE|nr:protein N-terminal asparagine amidohydrolase-like [Mizuhopecten yessoensis]XP_021374540.1 protein N-terminal asparagine amidohydrolase-like [Mizuhopecten yessoensis]XP_021374541.1 protein N-terminal asparagine amidohydrolase-like [Mizuhopecten yessoensis]XP_021374542.1 protein N-terminal asparagine amidohydrolase-like [Mizuhopecten yessoensis]XP_021374543.1 protein N-terminal asparagine amidohydrolase-like [Mizuhopecten yessoensis]XP_021374544.1 protein N-terminal asparagine amidohydrolase-
MPLIINGNSVGQVPKSLQEFFDRYDFKDSSQHLCCQSNKMYTQDEGILYVGQREMAATTPEDGVFNFLGTEDATTCHMVVLRHTESGAVCLAHFDGSGIQKAAKDMIRLVKGMAHSSGRLQLHLIGGFCDDSSTSAELSIKTLEAFHDNEDDIHLETCCITDLNSIKKKDIPFPNIYGIAVDIKTGEISRASFADHGPDQPLRSARHFTGSEEVINIYDPKRNILTIGPFNYSTMDEIDLLCGLPKNFIREHLSTSPAQEPAHFEDHVRAALLQIKEHPQPMKTIFKDEKPRCYKLENKKWKPVSDS